jgi:hypothetical protein
VTARAQEIRTGLAWLHAADPVLAQVIDDRTDFDPDVFLRRLPAMDPCRARFSSHCSGPMSSARTT